jgi:hypothetical protein
MRRLRHAVYAGLFLPGLVWAQGPKTAPAPPQVKIPQLKSANVTIVCGDCGRPFDTETHEKVLEGLVSNPYNEQLRKALYTQDSLHQFESKAHFDNCDFDGAIGYLDELLGDVDANVKRAVQAKTSGNQAAAQGAVKDAFFSLGQALHGVQDFYAHSNYVEMSVKGARSFSDLSIVTAWTPEGKKTIGDLRGKGLISGFVFWGVPQKCPSGTLSHSALAKDKAGTKSGAVKIARLENRSQYQIAVQLARATSQALVDHAFSRWPLLKEFNGPNAAFEVLLDARAL